MGYLRLPCARMRPAGVRLTYRREATGMTATEERLAALEQGFENEWEWRREMLARLDKIESNQRWLVGLPIMILIAVIASNWIG